MRAKDLDLRELLDFESQEGLIRFAGQRALIVDAVALGLLRQELIATVGMAAARGIFTRFGFAHGWRTAETMREAFPWDSEQDWRRAGGRLHTLQGLVLFESVNREPGDASAPFAEATWKHSYEAEQHLLHHGQADEPVCWTLTGFASGYLSFTSGRKILCLEDRCIGKGDATCHMIGKSREEWGEAVEQVVPFYEKGCDAVLEKTTSALRQAEQQLRARRKELARVGAKDEERSGMTVRSDAMKRVMELAGRVAKVDSTVLITGESGVGKERLARYVHDESPRSSGPFIAINCGALPEGLLESELFGHARGAFTGALQDRAGLFEAASGGTLFLDEIGEVSAPMQVKLLRALQEREVRRVGENKSRPVNVRVLAATNRDLAAEVLAKHFRQDLYYRLRVVELRVPPLRERKEDLLPLARVLLADASRRMSRKISGFTPRAINRLLHYPWPGNVRELENAIERAVAVTTGTRIDVDDLPEEVGASGGVGYTPGDTPRSLASVERDYILSVLEANGGNRAKTAEQLDIGTATLFRKLKEYNVRKRV